jgi:MazG family protein
MSDEQQNFPEQEARSKHLERARRGDESLGRSLALVRYLRAGCDWDAKQTPDTLRPYLLEEAHEVAEAIRGGDDRELESELGDLLLNLAFQIVLAEERGTFAAEDVAAALERKMIERHPHLYGDADSPPDWEELKARLRARDEPGRSSETDPFDGVPRALESLSRSLRLQDRAAARGFDWPDVGGAIEKLREELSELESELASKSGPAPGDGTDRTAQLRRDRIEDEVGDLLFAAVNVARLAAVHPSVALDRASEKFASRFRALLALAEQRGIDPDEADLHTLDLLWNEVKISRR